MNINDDWDLENYELKSENNGFEIYFRIHGEGPAGWNWLMVTPWESKSLGYSEQHLESHKLLQAQKYQEKSS
jgi:hypothetical protein